MAMSWDSFVEKVKKGEFGEAKVTTRTTEGKVLETTTVDRSGRATTTKPSDTPKNIDKTPTQTTTPTSFGRVGDKFYKDLTEQEILQNKLAPDTQAKILYGLTAQRKRQKEIDEKIQQGKPLTDKEQWFIATGELEANPETFERTLQRGRPQQRTERIQAIQDYQQEAKDYQSSLSRAPSTKQFITPKTEDKTFMEKWAGRLSDKQRDIGRQESEFKSYLGIKGALDIREKDGAIKSTAKALGAVGYALSAGVLTGTTGQSLFLSGEKALFWATAGGMSLINKDMRKKWTQESGRAFTAGPLETITPIKVSSLQEGKIEYDPSGTATLITAGLFAGVKTAGQIAKAKVDPTYKTSGKIIGEMFATKRTTPPPQYKPTPQPTFQSKGIDSDILVRGRATIKGATTGTPRPLSPKVTYNIDYVKRPTGLIDRALGRRIDVSVQKTAKGTVIETQTLGKKQIKTYIDQSGITQRVDVFKSGKKISSQRIGELGDKSSLNFLEQVQKQVVKTSSQPKPNILEQYLRQDTAGKVTGKIGTQRAEGIMQTRSIGQARTVQSGVATKVTYDLKTPSSKTIVAQKDAGLGTSMESWRLMSPRDTKVNIISPAGKSISTTQGKVTTIKTPYKVELKEIQLQLSEQLSPRQPTITTKNIGDQLGRSSPSIDLSIKKVPQATTVFSYDTVFESIIKVDPLPQSLISKTGINIAKVFTGKKQVPTREVDISSYEFSKQIPFIEKKAIDITKRTSPKPITEQTQQTTGIVKQEVSPIQATIPAVKLDIPTPTIEQTPIKPSLTPPILSLRVESQTRTQIKPISMRQLDTTIKPVLDLQPQIKTRESSGFKYISEIDTTQKMEQSPKIEQVPRIISKVSPIQKIDQQQKIEQQQEQRITEKIQPQRPILFQPQINIPFRPEITPGFPMPTFSPRFTSTGSQGVMGFNVLTRRAGKVERLNPVPLSFEEATNLGQYTVGKTARASFKVVEAGREATGTFKGKGDKSTFKMGKEGWTIEKRKYRISSPGEKQEITLKGILSSKKKRKRK